MARERWWPILVVLAVPIACVAWTVTHEEIFREPREYCAERSKNGRSLFGLSESLKAQGQLYEAQLVRREFESAWKDADTNQANGATNRSAPGTRSA